MTVYVLVAVGVCDAGVVGVYSDPDAARAAAEEIWPQTDGYHAFDIRKYVLGETRPEAFPYGFSRRGTAEGEARIEVEEPIATDDANVRDQR